MKPGYRVDLSSPVDICRKYHCLVSSPWNISKPLQVYETLLELINAVLLTRSTVALIFDPVQPILEPRRLAFA